MYLNKHIFNDDFDNIVILRNFRITVSIKAWICIQAKK